VVTEGGPRRGEGLLKSAQVVVAARQDQPRTPRSRCCSPPPCTRVHAATPSSGFLAPSLGTANPACAASGIVLANVEILPVMVVVQAAECDRRALDGVRLKPLVATPEPARRCSRAVCRRAPGSPVWYQTQRPNAVVSLSYVGSWWSWPGSNRRPRECHGCGLRAEQRVFRRWVPPSAPTSGSHDSLPSCSPSSSRDSKMSVGVVLERRIFRPLTMRDTGFGPATNPTPMPHLRSPHPPSGVQSTITRWNPRLNPTGCFRRRARLMRTPRAALMSLRKQPYLLGGNMDHQPGAVAT
jgi:hypothetical protein